VCSKCCITASAAAAVTRSNGRRTEKNPAATAYAAMRTDLNAHAETSRIDRIKVADRMSLATGMRHMNLVKNVQPDFHE